ncbi:parvulin-like peptidyl-prolyl isomerase [Sphingomonas aurantiaca]|uniref:peptidylprolyl isomerase n=1 Tax=Sphingomonas aurantiaca TaxID=185949 RepID=A0A2T5GGK8_9SPHN|nr:peptidylprolyl isomerase [Sphingomonas aurantiaca]PTQ58469.1 parvulin-like peptidyl-prolyl isomerase [Sphingomonas aurantiaca]
MTQDTASPTPTPPPTLAPAGALWDVHQPVGRRSLLLAAIGALLGLGIAGYGLFTAQGTRTASIPAEDAALVNAIPVLRADLIAQVTALYSVPYAQTTRSQRQKVLDDMVREELYVQRGVEMGLSNDDIDVRQALVQATEGQIAQDAATAKPAEDELRGWYTAHRAKYASEGLMTLHEWRVPAGADPQRAVAALRSGTAPDALGLKTTGRVDDGEEFYFAAHEHLGTRVFAVARGLADGAISNPIPSPDGVHIVQMIRNTRPVATPYPEARDQVLRDFLADKIARLQEGNKRFLKKRADIKIAADLQ